MAKRSPPNLNDVAEREAYRQELRGVAVTVRRAGLALSATGVAAAFTYRLVPGFPFWIVLAIIGGGFGLMVLGMVMRSRYHRRRMRGEG